MPKAKPDPLAAAELALREFALSFPQSNEEHPWGERAMKVKGKVFLFLSRHDGVLHLSVKLPLSAPDALKRPFTEPTGYGLGKHGWVTSHFAADDPVPLELLTGWIDESYRAVAPKSVLAKWEAKEGEVAVFVPKPKKRKM